MTRLPPGPERDALIRQMLADGATQVAIAQRLGVTRQRIEQIAKAGGCEPRMVRIRRESAAKRATVVADIAQRKADRKEGLRQRAIAQLQSFVATYGRSPTTTEMGYRPGFQRHPHFTCSVLWPWRNSTRRAFAAAGIATRPVGERGHLTPRQRPHGKQDH